MSNSQKFVPKNGDILRIAHMHAHEYVHACFWHNSYFHIFVDNLPKGLFTRAIFGLLVTRHRDWP